MKIKKKDANLQDYAMMERHQMMRGVGYGETALQRPQIGVVSSWGEINPAANHLDKVAFLTDGRFSGTNKGCAVAHIAPEASAGGTLAVVEDGDLIEIDIPGKKLELHVPENELARRLEDWTPPDKKMKPGYLSIYSKMATSPDKGAALDYGHKPTK